MYLSAKSVAQMMAVDGRAPSDRRVRDWTAKGVRIGGRLVKLACLMLPQGRVYTAEHVRAFVDELTLAQRGLTQINVITKAKAETREQGVRGTAGAMYPPVTIHPGGERRSGIAAKAAKTGVR